MYSSAQIIVPPLLQNMNGCVSKLYILSFKGRLDKKDYQRMGLRTEEYKAHRVKAKIELEY